MLPSAATATPSAASCLAPHVFCHDRPPAAVNLRRKMFCPTRLMLANPVT
jgi:hypothetical protein